MKFNSGPLSFNDLQTYSLHERPSKVGIEQNARPFQVGGSFSHFLSCLPKHLASDDLSQFVDRFADASKNGRPLLFGIGAHVIKVGLNPILIDLMESGLMTGLAMNGACIVHDVELALAGKTSEDVDAVLGSGSFGAAKETGEFINKALLNRKSDQGFGELLGDLLLESKAPYAANSLLASARRLSIPVTVHVAIGTDIVHIHPTADGAAIGAASYYDFQLFCRLVSTLEGGVYINVGSAVLLPEVFLKALTVARNLGYTVCRFTTANFDFIRQYRSLTNVVCRPTAEGGKGFHFTGHHELMIPLLAAALKERIASGG
jgi:hypothetical protein